jgi:uncharacterized protein YndB with AHSA1/START domain
MSDIRHALVIGAPPERIIELAATAEGLAAWWAEDAVRLPGDDAVQLGFFDRTTIYKLRRAPEADGVRWRCETGQEWAGTELVFHARPAGTQTRLEFAHEGWAAATPYFVSCNTVWGRLMFKLKEAAEHPDAARPLFTRSGMDTGGATLY